MIFSKRLNRVRDNGNGSYVEHEQINNS